MLLVDDEPQVLVALEDLLSDEFIVLKSESPEEALEIAANTEELAVIVSDQRMPRLPGSELFARLGNASTARRILVTGFADLSAVVRAVNDGKIFAYVTKPWDGADLKQKVHQAADQFRLVKEVTSERQLLQDLMQNVPDGICFKDRQLRIRGANRAFALLMGVPEETDLSGRTLDEISPDMPNIAENREQELRILATGEVVLDAVRDLSQHGNTRWVSETKAPVRGMDGSIVGLVGITRDVTERVLMTQSLGASERRLTQQTRLLNAILNSMRDSVIAADLEGGCLLFNREAEKMFGSAAPSGKVSDWARAQPIHERDDAFMRDENPLLRAVLGHRVDDVEVVLNASGDKKLLTVAGSELRDEQGARVGGLALVRDVTAQRSLEKQLVQAQKMEAIGRLAGGVAHDFNNLLSIIASYGNFVKQTLTEGTAMEDVDQILSAVNRAAGLTRQLLAIGRRQATNQHPIQINEVVQSMEQMLRRVIGEDIRVSTRLSPSLGLVKADVGQLEQVLLNLAVNARDAMPNGGTLTFETSQITVAPTAGGTPAPVPPGEYVKLTVVDTGSGIAPEDLKRVFEPFFTTKETGKGTGLGLATVYGIVHQVGGNVDVSTELGRGTCFTILLPVADAAVVGASAGSVSTLPPPPTAVTVLLVEDDDAVRTVTSRILQARGYKVFEARSPSEALRIRHDVAEEIHLLLADVTLPELTGVELARKLAEFSPEMRVLFMSGYTDLASRDMQDVDARVAYLEKPFSPYSLAEKVSEILSAKS